MIDLFLNDKLFYYLLLEILQKMKKNDIEIKYIRNKDHTKITYFIDGILTRNGLALEFMHEKNINYGECLIAVNQNPKALKFCHEYLCSSNIINIIKNKK